MAPILPLLVMLLAVAFFTKVDFFFYLLYAVFGIYVLGRLWARRSLAAVSVQRRYDQRVLLGQSFTVSLKVYNRSRLPVLWMRLTDSVPADLSTEAIFRRVLSLMPREELELSYRLAGRRRGYYTLGPLSTYGGDPLGSTTYEFQQAQGEYVIVYPRIVPLRDLGFPSQSPFGSLPSRNRVFEDPSRIQGVREYQPGDSLRRLDWKTSARLGSLQVRRYEPAIALETSLFLNLRAADYPSDGRRRYSELAIVVAASLAVHVIEKRQALGLTSNGDDPLRSADSEEDKSPTMPALPAKKGSEHLTHVLDLLARVVLSSGPAQGSFLEVLNRGTLGLPWGSTAVVVTPCEEEGLMGSLLALRRRGLVVVLVLTYPSPDSALTIQRASQIGVQALQVASERSLDVWR